jgi:hypothetical protein
MRSLKSCCALACLTVATALACAAERDPTRPPEAARAAASAAQASPDTSDEATDELQQALQHRMVIKGQPYLVERGWLRGVGDRLGKARIERIEARSVWLRDEQGLRKLDLFPQVDIHTSPAQGAAPPASAVPRPVSAPHRRRPTASADLKDKAP